ncbi:MAG TPA: xanthine dehydrogenase family protein molybdopterin-binding subunit [Thermomicrobiales bacterium]|nr:xanthine dehydrogenase family protein molybdopterin-binding subunit [Thermomicrobiales bacterium]
MTRQSVVGAPLPRHDALGKVTGATRYPGDLLRPDMLRLNVVFAGRPHARIVRIDPSAALAQPGVVAVFTAADVPYNAFGLIDHDQPVLCGDAVRFTGDKVALVCAETEAAAEAAAKLVHVEYEDLPAVFDAQAALAPEAPLVHAGRGTNQLLRLPIRRGDVAAGFAAADVVLDGTFTTSWQEHAFLQPEAGIAFIDDDRVVVETAGQWLHEDRKQIAQMLGLPEEQVVIRYAAIGGAFGGREDLSVQHLLALAAWKLRRPVGIVWSREESIVGHHKRHPMRIDCRWGATRAGKLTAVEATIWADGGAYASTSEEVTKVATLFANGVYAVPNVAATGYAVYTNNVPCGAFRGFGAPQAQFAAEVMMTRLAEAIGINPVEFRRRNLYREGDIEPTQQPLPAGVSAIPVLEACLAEMARQGMAGPRGERRAAREDGSPSDGRDPSTALRMTNDALGMTAEVLSPLASRLRRGVGVACGMKNLGYSFGYPEQSTATVELFGRGEIERAVVRIGAADVGQGSHLALRQIAADALELPPERIAMVTDDSSTAPNAGSASASRMTLMGGRAVHDAARQALDQYRNSDDERVEATVQFRPPATTMLAEDDGSGIPNYCYGYAAQAVEVEVDLATGQVRIVKIVSAHDVGQAINRQQVEGQIEGCLAQAIGYALLEDFRIRDGQVLTAHLSTYLLPTALDVPPEIIPVVLELADPHGPFGARGVAELPLVPFLGAVANAIHDATGVWLTDQPFTPERVLAALTRQAEQDRDPDATATAPA